FGLGGVGSYAAEALARSGVGTLYIYDNDTVCESNINRQLIALDSTQNQLKTAVMKARLLDINPDINIYDNPIFITPQSDIPFENFDFIIDAVDNVTAKIFIALKSQELAVPLISVMGTGNKIHPENLKISDIYKTYECPLCKVMRTELKKRGIKKLMAVWSDERPLKNLQSQEKTNTGRNAVSSMIFVPASAGLMAASYAIRELIK
ncbi:MAG: tRNA threonylcarbamoyladenosine dehydratase, partial [Clostridia bacterium]|nr:tRNA threonylcarbamoyladenosine dehydratase [Clostridia bacterium]